MLSAFPPRFVLLALGFAAAAVAVATGVDAHPVAQGALEVRVTPGQVEVHARVSVEEVFVASAFSTAPGSAGNTLEEVWKTHGGYLLAHLHLSVDGQPLAGRVTAVAPPPSTDPAARVGYRFTYPLDRAGVTLPERLRVEEDVLREFAYAPGNPWTASYVVRVEQPGRAATVEALLLDRDRPLEFPLVATGGEGFPVDSRSDVNHARLVRDYLVHGLWHILTGYDHMLFMAALALAAVTFRDLVKVVSVFTLAHTLTLTLSVLDLVRLPGRVVEPAIAASIVVVALQNVFTPTRTRGWGRLAVVFGFGLFHGLGFAGGLREAMAGLPALAIGTAIAAFSVGVELGHQCVVLPIFGVARLVEQRGRPSAIVPARTRRALECYGSALVCAAGAFYLVATLR